MCRYYLTLLPAVILAVIAAKPVSAQAAENLLGRWEFVSILNEQGKPDIDSEGAVALTFTIDGVLEVERTAEARAAALDAPDRIGYLIKGNLIILDVEDEVEYGKFWFEGDNLVIFDRERGLTAYLRRPPK
jgi:hypothetical protein